MGRIYILQTVAKPLAVEDELVYACAVFRPSTVEEQLSVELTLSLLRAWHP